MKKIVNLFICFSLLFLISCKSEEEEAPAAAAASGGSSGGSTTKSLFSEWEVASDSFVFTDGDRVDLTGGSFDTLLVLYNVEVTVTSEWRNTLIAVGRTNVPAVGNKYLCDYFIYIVGSEASGAFILDTNLNTDSFTNNACLVLDNYCLDGSNCWTNSDHTYTKEYIDAAEANSLVVDWFGTGDDTTYFFDLF